jgi:hypothetical protein
MMWKLLQLAVFVAVVGSNIEWRWTDNGYVAAFFGIAAALVVTLIVDKAFRLLAALKLKLPARLRH